MVKIKLLPEAAADPNVVEELERVLAEAKAGNIRAFAIVYLPANPDSLGSTSWRATTGRDRVLLAGVFTLAGSSLIESIRGSMMGDG